MASGDVLSYADEIAAMTTRIVKAMNEILDKVRLELREASDEKTRETGLRFFKEEVNLYGIRSKTVSEIARVNYALVKQKPKQEIFSTVRFIVAVGHDGGDLYCLHVV
ncbi:MAG: DNA alkylation repair protein [Marinilabiliales bacterium]|nr:DNA alkylation repair protein [Marinilabiliales bacterium]